jgi:hypothetical protein
MNGEASCREGLGQDLDLIHFMSVHSNENWDTMIFVVNGPRTCPLEVCSG